MNRSHTKNLRQFYIAPEKIDGNTATIEGAEVRHLRTVLRLSQGDVVMLFDGCGSRYRAQIDRITSTKVFLTVMETTQEHEEKNLSITLALSIIKAPKMNYSIRGAVELGVDRIIPLRTERTVVRLAAHGEQTAHEEKWRRIAIQASKQTKRVFLPRILPCMDFNILMREAAPQHNLVFMPSLKSDGPSLKEIANEVRKPLRILVIIGPEGGFTEDELTTASRAGAHLISLGTYILRAETAAIAVIAIINHEFNHSDIKT